MQGFLALLSSAFLYGMWGVFARFASDSFPLYYSFLVRSVIVGILCLIILLFNKTWKKVRMIDVPWFFIRMIFGIIAGVTIYIAFSSIPLGTTYLVSYVGMTIGGFILGNIIFQERLTKNKFGALILALSGLFLIYSFNFDLNKGYYVILALVNGVANAITNTFSKKVSLHYGITQVVTIDFLASSVLYLVASLYFHEAWVLPSLTYPWLFILLFAFLQLGAALLVVVGFKHIEAQIGSIIMLTEVLFGALFGFIIFHEQLQLTTILGGLAIIIAMILPELSFKPKQVKSKEVAL